MSINCYAHCIITYCCLILDKGPVAKDFLNSWGLINIPGFLLALLGTLNGASLHNSSFWDLPWPLRLLPCTPGDLAVVSGLESRLAVYVTAFFRSAFLY